MRRRFPAAVCLDQYALCRLNRFRRGTGQPLSRIVNAIVHEFLDIVHGEQRSRGSRRCTATHRRRT
jgi:hypothetical protein